MVILVGIGIFYLIRMSSIIIFEKHDCVGVSKMFWSKTKIIVKWKKIGVDKNKKKDNIERWKR